MVCVPKRNVWRCRRFRIRAAAVQYVLQWSPRRSGRRGVRGSSVALPAVHEAVFSSCRGVSSLCRSGKIYLRRPSTCSPAISAASLEISARLSILSVRSIAAFAGLMAVRRQRRRMSAASRSSPRSSVDCSRSCLSAEREVVYIGMPATFAGCLALCFYTFEGRFGKCMLFAAEL